MAMATIDEHDAKRLIETISSDHTLNDTLAGTRAGLLLSNCLDILSSQLYETSTHFLLEVIQNADDNLYDNPTPSLSFSYSPGRLRIDCNEVGFAPQNVEAICAIGKSTKADKSSDGEAIGEKGLGFKSVFKVADVVWIVSREYRFKLDKRRFLGTVTPIWEDFPEPVRPGWTSMLLQLSADYDEQLLVNELSTFDANLLVFLRRLKEIHIRVASRDVAMQETRVNKTETHEGENRITTLHAGDRIIRYLIRDYIFKDLPAERKRPNWQQSKISVGFPIFEASEHPIPIPQKVYAFLPIRNYGLKFLVQADFILTASREDIESTLAWNGAIRDAFVQAFLDSIRHFHESDGEMKYTWPWYIPNAPAAMDTFFDPAAVTISQHLQKTPVLESCAGIMAKPSALKHVPPDLFADDSGTPFTLYKSTAARYLSSKYPSWAIKGASSIGVSELSPQEFLADLKAMIAEAPADFSAKPSAWHAQLALALFKLTTDRELLAVMKSIRLIPLRDGTWASTDGKPVFFAKNSTSFAIPSGIQVLIADLSAETDDERRKLFVALGVKPWEAPEICHLILKLHEASDFDASKLTAEQLVSHAAFLYKASWQPPKDVKIWFAAMHGKRCLGRELYMPGSSEPDSPSYRVFAKLQTQFAVIHEDYLVEFQTDPQWPLWLINSLGVSMVPRLITPFVEPRPQPVQAAHTHDGGHTQETLSSPPLSPLSEKVVASPKNHHTSSDWLIESTEIVDLDASLHDNIAAEDSETSESNSNPLSSDDSTTESIPSDPLAAVKYFDEKVQRSQALIKRLLLHPPTPEEGPASRHPQHREPSHLPRPHTHISLSHHQSIADVSDDPPQIGYITFHGGTAPPSFHNGCPVPDRTMEEKTSFLIKCICGFLETDGRVAICYKCDTVYHVNCYDRHGLYGPLCFDCAPRPILKIGAADKQWQCHKLHSVDSAQPEPIIQPPTWDFTEVGKKRQENAYKEKHGHGTDDETANVGLPAPEATSDPIFSLSEEFTFMFHECQSSDVLEILKDNWQYYSQWIDGAHMKWQDSEFARATTLLKTTLAQCIVQTAKGALPLCETVLPTVDRRLDESRCIAALEVQNPQHPGWKFLGFFGVPLQANIHYYLSCLIAISEKQDPDIDDVAYVYEKIQSLYKGNEHLVNSLFQARDIVFIHACSSTVLEQSTWVNMKNCLERNIDVESIYPSSSYLFRCLSSPVGDPLVSILATAKFITSSSKLDDIIRFFRDISKALKDINASQAAELLRPLRNLSAFPISDGPGQSTFDRLLGLNDRSWFVADRPLLRRSFHGKIPLLAFPDEILALLDDVLRVLRLDDRFLSKLTKSQTRPGGRPTIHWGWTKSLREKAPFIQALIPQSHPNRTDLMSQISHISASVASQILQTFAFISGAVAIEGNPVESDLGLSTTGGMIHIYLTEKCAVAEAPPYELVRLIADACGIQDPNHSSLLYTTLANQNLESIHITFSHQGIHIAGLVFDKLTKRYQAQRSSLLRIPSPFWGSLGRDYGCGRDIPDVATFRRSQGGWRKRSLHNDRRLPITQVPRVDGLTTRDLQPMSEEFKDHDQIQHLGEHMLSRVLQCHLGSAYDADRDWTSSLRSRSGHKTFEWSTPCAAFTFKDPGVVSEMTRFVVQFGRSHTLQWKDRLRAGPLTYHLDVVINKRSGDAPFMLSTSQFERMREFALKDGSIDSETEVSILARLSDAYSPESLGIELIVDPWCLVHNNSLRFEKNWMLTGTLQDSDPNPQRKRRKFNSPSTPWGVPVATTLRPERRSSRNKCINGETYTYRGLQPDEIRLVHILPGEIDDPLHCLIVHLSSNSASEYQALSYVWGEYQRTHEISTPDGVLGITSSLNAALRGLRSKTRPTILWVDAICINQQDSKEKEKQIRLLPRIFQSASETIAFLHSGDSSEAAIEMLMQIRVKESLEESSKFRKAHNNGANPAAENDTWREVNSDEDTEDEEDHWPEDLPEIPPSWNNRRVPQFSDPLWTHVQALFSLPWFRRAWIVQEAVAAYNVKVVCGKRSIDWSDIHFAIEVIEREIELYDGHVAQLRSSWEPFLSLAAQREWEARRNRWSLLMLLENFRYAQSTLRRDRIFALLGLACDGDEKDFEPDYSSPLEDVVLRFARVFVRQGRGMQLLYRAGLNDQAHRFPSWIPDWTVPRANSLQDSSENGTSFGASGPQQPQIRCSLDTDELMVDGYTVDVIESISTSCNTEEDVATYLAELDNMIDSAVLSALRDSKEDLKWKVPIAGVLCPRVAVPGGHDLYSSYTALRNYGKLKRRGKCVETSNCDFLECTSVPEQGQGAELQVQSASYRAALHDNLLGWRFVVTQKGYVGTVPNRAKVGDTVAILKGGHVPFILQKSAERDGATRLVGECYVHGIMNGEGLSLPGVISTTFRLH